MNLQYISDNTGKTTGVLIPISEWKEFKSRYKGIDKEDTDIPVWQMNEVKKRLQEYRNSPEQGLDFDSVMDDIERDL